jgi:cysteine synthase A
MSLSYQQHGFGYSVAIGAAGLVTSVVAASLWRQNQHKRQGNQSDDKAQSSSTPANTAGTCYEALIGNTPMVHLSVLSALIQRDIYVKMESLNPGGTGKDRAALGMIRAAEESGGLPTPDYKHSMRSTIADTSAMLSELESCVDPLDASILEAMRRSRTGGLVVEGTSGSTGISLATLCASRGHACLVVLPDDQAVEKQTILKTLGAVVHVVPNAAISNPHHYVNVARRLARRAVACGIRAVFTDQFENPANYAVHYAQTGPEIHRQCPDLAAFVMSSGTGGTIAGVGRCLKELTLSAPFLNSDSSGGSSSSVKVVLVDPPGSSLYHKIQHGIAFALQQRERNLKRHRYDTLAEGIGLDRVTHNLSSGLDSIDEAIQVTDQEAVDMAHWLLQAEGLWVGSSSAMNVVGAVRTALNLDPNSKVVTIICDTGQRHVTRFWNRDFILSWGLQWPKDDNRIPDCLQDIIQANI